MIVNCVRVLWDSDFTECFKDKKTLRMALFIKRYNRDFKHIMSV